MISSLPGLTNDQIKQFVLKFLSAFGGSKNEMELTCQLFPQKFEGNDKLSTLYGTTVEYSDESQMWSKLAECGKKDAFKTDKILMNCLLSGNIIILSFSHSDHLHGIQTQTAIGLNQESQDRIDRNLANHLVKQLSNNPSDQIIRRRTQCLKSHDQIQSLVNSGQTNVTDIGRANVSKVYQLEKDGGKHGLVSQSINDLDSLSYITASLYMETHYFRMNVR
nr:5160_t:CDS:2 [Entrophospora candida]